MSDETTFSRREFIKDAALGAAAAAGAGVLATLPAEAQTTTPPSGIPAKWDYEADVVVVGYGGAGAVAAITAFDAGAKVLIIEKLPKDTETKINHTCSTRFSGGSMLHFKSKEGAIKWMTLCSRGATPDDVIASWAEYACKTKDWVEGMGGKLTASTLPVEYPVSVFPAVDTFASYSHEGGGAGLFKTLSTNVDKRKIPILYETPGTRLIYNGRVETGDGEVVGVVATQGGKQVFINAHRAVILTSGGFEYDFDMLNTYCYGFPARFYANPGNTGDGIRMAQAVGAQLWHMELLNGRPITYFADIAPGFGANAGQWPPYVHVDKYGKRYIKVPWKATSSWTQMMWWDCDLFDFPRIPSYSIFDQSSVDAIKGPLFGKFNYSDYQWSKDNSVEIAKGWILKGQTLQELAAQINKDPEVNGKMKPETLVDTITRYNKICEAGVDTEIGSAKSTLLPITHPPYYAVKVYPGGVCTLGGPRRNPHMQVVNSFGKGIKGLYSGGELGSVLGFVYSGSGYDLCELVVSGQISGKFAAAEKPWDAKG